MKYVIVDIDGTIADCSERAKKYLADKKDWDAFYEACDQDKPIMPIIEMVRLFSEHYQILFCTGRRESIKEKTVFWMTKHLSPKAHQWFYLMRKDGDFRHDTEVKPELLESIGINLEDIAFVLEDRNSMVKKWRSLGLTCLQVADGDF